MSAPREPHKDDLPDSVAIRRAENKARAATSAVRIDDDDSVHIHPGQPAIANVVNDAGELRVAVLVISDGIVPSGCIVGSAVTLEGVDRLILGLQTAADHVRRQTR